MTLSQKAGQDMSHKIDTGASVEVRARIVRAHRDDMLAAAATERQALAAHTRIGAVGGLRRGLGHALIRAGRAVARETPKTRVHPA